MEEFPVQLWIYDLSHGIANRLSKMLSKTHIEGIWHTSIVVFDREIWYGNGITTAVPGTCHLGLPHQIMALGTTKVDERTFDEFLNETRRYYTAERYHLLGFNCNVFTNLCALFLTGHSIPETIQDLPIDFVSTTIGKLTNPVIQALYRSTLHKDTLMDPNQPDFEIEEDEEQIRSVEGPSSPSSSSYGQTLASTTVGAGRAVISAGGKMVRMVVNTSSSIRGSTVG